MLALPVLVLVYGQGTSGSSGGNKQVENKEEGFASDAQRRAAFASGYKEKGKKKKEEVEKDGKTATGQKPTKVEIEPEVK